MRIPSATRTLPLAISRTWRTRLRSNRRRAYLLIENVDYEVSVEHSRALTDVIEAHIRGGDLTFDGAVHARRRQRIRLAPHRRTGTARGTGGPMRAGSHMSLGWNKRRVQRASPRLVGAGSVRLTPSIHGGGCAHAVTRLRLADPAANVGRVRTRAVRSFRRSDVRGDDRSRSCHSFVSQDGAALPVRARHGKARYPVITGMW
jgi:hypothetical protein